MTSPPQLPRPLRVAVVPAAEHAARARLFAALGTAEHAVFEPCRPGEWAAADLVLAIGSDGAQALRDDAPGVPTLLLHGGRPAGGDEQPIAMADDPELSPVLRGALLADRSAGIVDHAGGGATILARTDDTPVWVRAGAAAHVVAATLEELAPGDALRERLEPGRCLALLALVHLLRQGAGADGWTHGPPRACFILDDPNLHWGTYGHVHYRRLLAHAREHRYHMVIGMVPLDGWFAHPGVVRRFRSGADHLSVTVHGNDHRGPELGALQDRAASLAVAAQALRRTAAFERRTGLTVSRVMVPPHERASEAAAIALRDAGFEGLCTTRPYPWTATDVAQPWLTRPDGAGPLAGWGMTDVVAGGLPVVLRVDFRQRFDEVVLRAFLGQSVVLYGHHEDLSDDLARLAQRAGMVNALGEVRWGSLGDVVAGSAAPRRRGQVLEVRPAARRVVVDVPEGVRELHVDTSAFGPQAALAGATSEDRVVVAGPGPVTLRLASAAAAVDAVPAPPRRLCRSARRVAGEGRDRPAAAARG